MGPLTLEVGERVQVLFEVEGTPIDVEARVIRAERQDIINDRVAVAFENLSGEKRSLIHQLVSITLDEAAWASSE